MTSSAIHRGQRIQKRQLGQRRATWRQSGQQVDRRAGQTRARGGTGNPPDVQHAQQGFGQGRDGGQGGGEGGFLAVGGGGDADRGGGSAGSSCQVWRQRPRQRAGRIISRQPPPQAGSVGSHPVRQGAQGGGLVARVAG